eukprot:CAMPEP_0176484192 /NCGR_PEP_ID=MMETSP0200_2-20121128/4323_1 /TAXON_ID=947934 /ORGANISM="Chaetoceros sp., Strain GSL56" /LENGTH=506 /DNA_ID=CAMNT_0017880649 /DNA_START=798 /DNA_END=2318 /DNA_ORIENTATION=+
MMVMINHLVLLLPVTTLASFTTTTAAFVTVPQRTRKSRNSIRSTALFYNDNNKNSNSSSQHHQHDDNNKPSSWWWLSAPEWMLQHSDTTAPFDTPGKMINQEVQEPIVQQQQPLPPTEAQNERFAQGKELQDLRSDVLQMKQNLQLSLATDDLMRVVALTKSLEEAEKRDPEYVYTKALKMIAGAGGYNTKKKYQIITRYNKEAKIARSYIARLNMGGLWVANFGQGSELVNVTYSGDTMIATRLSAPDHFLFQADLSPLDLRSGSAQFAPPVPMDKLAVTKWGIDKLERYPGKAVQTGGRGTRGNNNYYNNRMGSSKTAKDVNINNNNNNNNSNLVDGNLIMFDGYFSFLWMPTRQHVFFSRPKPELVLKLLRDAISEEDEMENMRRHLTKCFNKGIEEAFIRPPVTMHDGYIMEPFRRISRESDLLAAQEEIQIVYEHREEQRENSPQLQGGSNNNKLSNIAGIGMSTSTTAGSSKPHQSFWDFHKWLHYIDQAMKPNEMENNN